MSDVRINLKPSGAGPDLFAQCLPNIARGLNLDPPLTPKDAFKAMEARQEWLDHCVGAPEGGGVNERLASLHSKRSALCQAIPDTVMQEWVRLDAEAFSVLPADPDRGDERYLKDEALDLLSSSSITVPKYREAMMVVAPEVAIEVIRYEERRALLEEQRNAPRVESLVAHLPAAQQRAAAQRDVTSLLVAESTQDTDGKMAIEDSIRVCASRMPYYMLQVALDQPAIAKRLFPPEAPRAAISAAMSLGG